MSEKPSKRKAAALSYDLEKSDAPVVVAMGSGAVADKIVQKAEENDIPVVPDENLASILTKMSVGDSIPPELYSIVAEILVFVSNVDDRFAGKVEGYSAGRR